MLTAAFQGRWCALGFFKIIGPGAEVWRILDYHEQSSRTMVVQLWKPGSIVTFFDGSHVENLIRTSEQLGFPQIKSKQFIERSRAHSTINLPLGGLYVVFHDSSMSEQQLMARRSFMDARLAFTIDQGYSIQLGYAEQRQLDKWAPWEESAGMTVEASAAEDIRSAVASLTTERIGLHVRPRTTNDF